MLRGVSILYLKIIFSYNGALHISVERLLGACRLCERGQTTIKGAERIHTPKIRWHRLYQFEKFCMRALHAFFQD